jgi:hypothetical protein
LEDEEFPPDSSKEPLLRNSPESCPSLKAFRVLFRCNILTELENGI